MSDQPKGFNKFWHELRRRNVFRVATVYLITAWLVIQIAVSVFPVLRLPSWVTTFVVVLFIIGQPTSVDEGIYLHDLHHAPDREVRHNLR